MSRVPRIDTPCPLDAQAQRGIDGQCAHCDKTVHRLDEMSDAARRALLAASDGPICVSYRVPTMHRVGRIGAVIAATLITATAYAAEPAKAPERPAATTGSRIPDQNQRKLDEVLLIGAVSDPQDAAAPEDTTVPALPVSDADARKASRRAITGSRIPDKTVQQLDEVALIGAVSDPQDAAAPEDRSVPELPVRDVQTALAEVTPEPDLDEITLIGGISDPGSVEWVEADASLPTLPVVSESTAGPR